MWVSRPSVQGASFWNCMCSYITACKFWTRQGLKGCSPLASSTRRPCVCSHIIVQAKYCCLSCCKWALCCSAYNGVLCSGDLCGFSSPTNLGPMHVCGCRPGWANKTWSSLGSGTQISMLFQTLKQTWVQKLMPYQTSVKFLMRPRGTSLTASMAVVNNVSAGTSRRNIKRRNTQVTT